MMGRVDIVRVEASEGKKSSPRSSALREEERGILNALHGSRSEFCSGCDF